MHAITKLGSFAAIASLGLGWILAACTSSTSSTTSEPTFVAHFDPTKSELPEGLYIDGDKAYVGYAPLGKIVRVDLGGGAVEDFGSIPPIPMNGGFLLGIVVDASGAVYVGFGGGPGTTVKNGVYKIPAGGGSVTAPWAADPAMSFPNGLLFDEANNLFVADSGGAVFKIDQSGTVTKWIADPSLAGTGSSCKDMAPFTIGANGIVKSGSAFYVSNTRSAQS